MLGPSKSLEVWWHSQAIVLGAVAVRHNVQLCHLGLVACVDPKVSVETEARGVTLCPWGAGVEVWNLLSGQHL